jgi:hypothetical protein
MGKTINARIEECEGKIRQYQTRLDRDPDDAKAAKRLADWVMKLEEATAESLRSLEKKSSMSGVSVRSTKSVGVAKLSDKIIYDPADDLEDDIIAKLAMPAVEDSSEARRGLLKNIRVIELACGLLHDETLENAPLETLEEVHKSLSQQAIRQTKSSTALVANLYCGLLRNGPKVINYFSSDLGFYIDEDAMTDSMKTKETIDNIQDAFAEIFEDSPEVKEMVNKVSRGLPKLIAVTAIAITPALRLGQKK